MYGSITPLLLLLPLSLCHQAGWGRVWELRFKTYQVDMCGVVDLSGMPRVHAARFGASFRGPGCGLDNPPPPPPAPFSVSLGRLVWR